MLVCPTSSPKITRMLGLSAAETAVDNVMSDVANMASLGNHLRTRVIRLAPWPVGRTIATLMSDAVLFLLRMR
ncbi:hypothetical protein D3C84_447600 [compost metagenome]